MAATESGRQARAIRAETRRRHSEALRLLLLRLLKRQQRLRKTVEAGWSHLPLLPLLPLLLLRSAKRGEPC